jgi:hypothetical protein
VAVGGAGEEERGDEAGDEQDEATAHGSSADRCKLSV